MTKKRGWQKGKKRGPMPLMQKEKLRVEWKKKLVRQKSEIIEKEKEKEKEEKEKEEKEEEKVYGKKHIQNKYGSYDL